jgi:uncharacterized zinc-type alcohol dehydrogenase-like protein
MIKSHGYAAQDAKSPLAPYSFDRADLQPFDVLVDIEFCGVCHSDLHQARNEWGGSTYPLVPGHEIVGKVREIGKSVTRFKVGDTAAVGVIIDSCRECAACKEGLEQYCERKLVQTYNDTDKQGNRTYGGYSNCIAAHQDFVHTISPKLDPAAVAPLLCAGITTYSPLRHAGIKKGMKVGVIGLGGLGHMGLKFAHSFGAHVVQFTTSAGKAEDAKRLGADEVVISKDENQMKQHAASFDFILDTVSAQHDLNQYLSMLKTNGELCQVGLPETPMSVSAFNLLRRRSFTGSMIGGMAETQEMLDYCAEHNIVSDIELIPVDKINEAYERLLKQDVKYRFVLDMKTLQQ